MNLQAYRQYRPTLINYHREDLLRPIRRPVESARSLGVTVLAVEFYPIPLKAIVGDKQGCFFMRGTGIKDVWLDFLCCQQTADQLNIPLYASLESYLWHETAHAVEDSEEDAWTLGRNLWQEFGVCSEAQFEKVSRFSLDTYRLAG